MVRLPFTHPYATAHQPQLSNRSSATAAQQPAEAKEKKKKEAKAEASEK